MTRQSIDRTVGSAVLAIAAVASLDVVAGAIERFAGRGPGRPSTLALAPCHLEPLAEEVLCGVHDVFENREAGAGRRIGIQVAVLPPLRRAAARDPLFILSGGPGQGARDYAGLAARYFRAIRRTRAIVLVDLRGTGGSHPLTCLRDLDEDLLREGADLFLARSSRCLAELDADVRHYTHAAALADLDEIREKLGYDRVNLWGGSWGTRAALLYALRYPRAVRRVVLDGAVPLTMRFPAPVAADANDALARLASRCAADPACRAAFPDPRAELLRLLDRLDEQPVTVMMRHPRTGARVRVALTRDAVAEIVRVALYTPLDTARVPMLVRHALDGDFAPLAAQMLYSAALSTTMSLGVTMSVLCSEDLPAGEAAAFAEASRGTFLGPAYADAWRQRCTGWPTGPAIDVPQDASSPAEALILSGQNDPVTPPRWGEEMARHFPKSLHLAVEGAAHNASFTGCIPDAIASFLDNGFDQPLAAACPSARELPAILTSDTGARP